MNEWFSKIMIWMLLMGFMPSVSFSDEVAGGEDLKMNQIQVVGTHNSYHLMPGNNSTLKANTGQKVYPWAYSHLPLDQQLTNGVRNLELDCHFYPDGIQIFHALGIDNKTHQKLFVDNLVTIRDWSLQHPNHVPLIVLLELKEYTRAKKGRPKRIFDDDGLKQLDDEVLSVFETDHLIRPDDIRGDAKSLRAAVIDKGWPSLESVRGKIMFVIHSRNIRIHQYADGEPSLKDKPLFMQALTADVPYAGVLILNDPYNDLIPKLVKQGFIVRTRGDANLKEAFAGDTTRRDQAFASGAHIITTDYPAGEAHKSTAYVVSVGLGLAARPNPANTP